MSDKTILMDIVKRIREIHLDKSGKLDPIPTSEDIYRRHLSNIYNNEKQCMDFLRMLEEAHFLFAMTLVEPDEALMIPGVEGYIVTEPVVLRNLRARATSELEQSYEQQFYQRKQATTIIRELLPRARSFNNTPLGRALNMAVMLQQFEHILVNEFEQYTDTWKSRKLMELMPGGSPDAETPSLSEGDFDPPPAGPGTPNAPLRAVDTDAVQEIQQMDQSGRWGDAVQKFGVEFLLRIHFRKYEFDKVAWLIKTGKLAAEKDLRYVRDTLRTMESRVDRDFRLREFTKPMVELKRAAQIKLNRIHQLRKSAVTDEDETV